MLACMLASPHLAVESAIPRPPQMWRAISVCLLLAARPACSSPQAQSVLSRPGGSEAPAWPSQYVVSFLLDIPYVDRLQSTPIR